MLALALTVAIAWSPNAAWRPASATMLISASPVQPMQAAIAPLCKEVTWNMPFQPSPSVRSRQLWLREVYNEAEPRCCKSCKSCDCKSCDCTSCCACKSCGCKDCDNCCACKDCGCSSCK